MQKRTQEPLWQDRDIRFDGTQQELSLRNGEKLIEKWSNVEDTKGNTGEIGQLSLTNLRIIWQSIQKPRINLSIGLNCIITITSRQIHTKLRGKNESLYMMTKINGTRYEFIFICLPPQNGVGDNNPNNNRLDSNSFINQSLSSSKNMIELVSGVCKAYTQTKLYRDLRLRSSIISSEQKQLKILSSEQIYNCVDGVWNLSSDQGNLGTMYMTNIRIVWHANINELFNISLPHIQIKQIKIRDSKFGLALVIESSELSGGYVLGFRIDPIEKLNQIYEELQNLYQIHFENPDFGVNHLLNDLNLSNSFNNVNYNQQMLNNQNDLTNAINSEYDPLMMAGDNDGQVQQSTDGGDYKRSSRNDDNNGYDPILAYLAEGETIDKPIHQWTYDPNIGLSIENIKDGFTIESLWEVVENVQHSK